MDDALKFSLILTVGLMLIIGVIFIIVKLEQQPYKEFCESKGLEYKGSSYGDFCIKQTGNSFIKCQVFAFNCNWGFTPCEYDMEEGCE